ncbi:uncharacterized protein LOC134280980 [Saccostrea cucullata]|uniref:uncharacterized protein LOC134280980 n=1 Tax=Saccostrea cuccullata TaxID=36930 RepID=UPI002ED34E70
MDIEKILMLKFLLLCLVMDSAQRVRNASCEIEDRNIETHRRILQHFISNEKAKLIYLNVSSTSYNSMTMEQTEWNRVYDWTWITEDNKHYLSYPNDIDVYTFGLMRTGIHKLSLNILINNTSNCSKEILWIRVHNYLQRLRNKSEGGYFCHRNFEHQDLKKFFHLFPIVSIGYDFDCFNGNITTPSLLIKTSIITYAIVVIIFSMLAYYPLIIALSLHGRKISEQLKYLTMADYPYTPRRFLLYIIFKSSKPNITRKLDRSFSSGMRLSFILLLVTGLSYAVKIILVNNYSLLPPNTVIFPFLFNGVGLQNDINIYVHIFIYTFFICFSLFAIATINSYLILSIESMNDCFVFFKLSSLKCSLIPVSDFLKMKRKENTMSAVVVDRFWLIFSLQFWSKVFLLPFVGQRNSIFSFKFHFRLVLSVIDFMINVPLILLFSIFPLVNQCYHFMLYFLKSCSFCVCKRYPNFVAILSLILTPVFIMCLLYNSVYVGMSCIVQFLIYVFLVAVPHLYSTQIHIFLFVMAILSYMSKYFVEFFMLYRQLLQKVIQLKKSHDILIKHFDYIIAQCCPIQIEVFFLLMKIILTTFLLLIIYKTLSEVNFLDNQSSINLNTIMVYGFIFLTSGILEILFFESNTDKVERIHFELDNQIRLLLNVYEPENETESEVEIDADKKMGRCLFSVRYVCNWCCGCMETPVTDEGYCRCCYGLEETDLGPNGGPTFSETHVSFCTRGSRINEYTQISSTDDSVAS